MPPDADPNLWQALLSLEDRLPEDLDVEDAALVVLKRSRRGLHGSLTVVLLQEVSKYNTLLGAVREVLGQLKGALRGLVALSPDLENALECVNNNAVP